MTPRGDRPRATACSLRDQVHASNERSKHDSHQVHTFLAGATALIVAALAAAGCGSSGGSNANSPAPPQNASGQSATVGVANENVGKILVDSQGRTLYLFERDSGTKSTCTGACAVEWPPLRGTGKPTVGDGANASIIATIARSDGKSQITYNRGGTLGNTSYSLTAGTYRFAIQARSWHVSKTSFNVVVDNAANGCDFRCEIDGQPRTIAAQTTPAATVPPRAGPPAGGANPAGPGHQSLLPTIEDLQ